MVKHSLVDIENNKELQFKIIAIHEEIYFERDERAQYSKQYELGVYDPKKVQDQFASFIQSDIYKRHEEYQ